MSYNMTVEGGKTIRLKTKGKYCDRDIVVTSEGGSSSILLQNKTVNPSTSKQSIQADSGYDGLGTVTVNAMPTATQATPSISVSAGGLITASATQSSGYVSSGTKSATKQLTVQAAKTITPSQSSQTAVASGRYTTGEITVAAIPSSYIQPSGTLPITSNGTYNIANFENVEVNVPAGEVESANVVIDTSKSTSDIKRIYFTQPNMTTGAAVMKNDITRTVCTVAKGSLLVIEAAAFDWDLSGNVSIISTNLQSYTLFYIQDNCEISAWSI